MYGEYMNQGRSTPKPFLMGLYKYAGEIREGAPRNKGNEFDVIKIVQHDYNYIGCERGVSLFKNENYKLVVGNCIDVVKKIPNMSIDMVFADPPYMLSNGGITCQSGKMVSVNKGSWDRSSGFASDYTFTKRWLRLLRRVLKPDGTIWVSGTYHNIYLVAFALNELGYSIINDISWFKPNAAPNISCKCFTASHETLLWAKVSKDAKYKFNYHEMKEMNGGKQMRSVWKIPTTPKSEKEFGKHPTQKPLQLLKRCILASTNPGDTILDPFCGSGTTGVAAIMLKRKFIGIEMDEGYAEIAAARLSSTV